MLATTWLVLLISTTHVVLLIGLHGERAVDHLAVFAGELIGGVEHGLFPVGVSRIGACNSDGGDGAACHRDCLIDSSNVIKYSK